MHCHPGPAVTLTHGAERMRAKINLSELVPLVVVSTFNPVRPVGFIAFDALLFQIGSVFSMGFTIARRVLCYTRAGWFLTWSWWSSHWCKLPLQFISIDGRDFRFLCYFRLLPLVEFSTGLVHQLPARLTHRPRRPLAPRARCRTFYGHMRRNSFNPPLPVCYISGTVQP